MSSSVRPQSTDLRTITETPVIDRKISGTPDRFDNRESIDSAQVAESVPSQSRTDALHSRGNTGDEYSTQSRKPIFDSPISTRANTGELPLHSGNVFAPLQSSDLPGNRDGARGVHNVPDNITGTSVSNGDHQTFNGLYSRRNIDDRTFSRPPRQSTVITNASLPFEETEAWDKKSLLALDGGGIRGYSSLLILKELMEKIAELERTYPGDPARTSFHPCTPPLGPSSFSGSSDSQQSSISDVADNCWLPCHYFDYMAGTSTGGLISIMLGRLRMNIDDCITDYEQLGDRVFGHSRWFHLRSPLWWPRDKYNHNRLRDVIQHVVNTRVPKVANFPGGKTFAYDENRCRTIVVAYQKESTQSIIDKPYIFRTYKNLHRSSQPEQALMDRNPDLAHDIPIWEVARATSAAPTYFEPVKIDGLEYIDGGFGANNPSDELYREVKKLHNGSTKVVGVLLSVGTGLNNSSRRLTDKTGLSRYLNYINFMKKWATDSEKTHHSMVEDARQDGFQYYRLNVSHGIGTMKLDEWKTRGKLRKKIGVLIGHCRKSAPEDHRLAQQTANGGTNVEKSFHQTKAIYSDSTLHIPKWFQGRNKTIEFIRKQTRDYLQSDDIQNELDKCAKTLVNGRRLRAQKDPPRWERTCYGAWYQCMQDRCLRGEKAYESKESLRTHFLDKHRNQFTRDERDREKLEEALEACKIIVQ